MRSNDDRSSEPGAGASAVLAAAAGGAPFAALLASSAALEAIGPDAAPFLHGQLANDVSGLPVGGAGRGLLLNHKGHALAEAQVLRAGADRLLLVVDDGRVDWVQETLERHIVFDEVALRRVPAAVVTVQGAGASEAVARAARELGAEPGSLPADGGLVAWAGEGWESFAYPVRRSEAGGYDVLTVGAGPDLQALLERAGAVPVDAAALDVARVSAAVPAAAREGGEGVLPQEAGLAGLVSFRKGCYLGQEIMARIEARGAVRRGLRSLELAGAPAGRDVSLAGKVVGRLGTVATLPDGSVRALVVLRNDVPDGASVSAGGVGGRVLPVAARRMPA